MTDLERHGTASEQTAAPRATVPLAGTLALVAGGFGVLGLLEGSGGALWPDVLDDFGISKGFYGVASGIGLTLAFPVLFYGGRLTTRFDKALLIAFAGVLLGAATFGLTTGAGAALFVVLMAARGVGIALLDMSANALAMDVEQRTGRHLMSPLHSGFSAGTMVGAGIAWIAFALGGDHVAVYVLMTALLALFVAGAVTVWRRSPVVRTRTEVAGASGASFRLLRLPRVRALAVITGIAFCGELLIAQWIGLYLRDERGYSASVGVRAVILLGGAMFLGRMVNGPITERLGSRVALLLQGSVVDGRRPADRRRDERGPDRDRLRGGRHRPRRVGADGVEPGRAGAALVVRGRRRRDVDRWLRRGRADPVSGRAPGLAPVGPGRARDRDRLRRGGGGDGALAAAPVVRRAAGDSRRRGRAWSAGLTVHPKVVSWQVELLDGVAGGQEPALVGLVGNGAAVGEDESPPGSLGDGVLRFLKNLVLGAVGERAELVPAAHQALAGHAAGLAQRLGRRGGPTS